MGTDQTSAARGPLSRQRVLDTAVALADRVGLKGLTMRAVAAELGVEAMSLYHHVANKEALLDGLAEVIVAEAVAVADAVSAPAPEVDWRGAVRARVLAARRVMLAHPWAPAVLQTRTSMSPDIMVWFDRLLGVMVAGGVSWDLGHQAMHALGSRALGFSQELFAPAAGESSGDEEMTDMAAVAETLPNLVAMLAAISHDEPDSSIGWCDDQAEFEFALDVLLDGIEDRRTRTP